MDTMQLSKKEFLSTLRGSHDRQELEQYSYYAKKVMNGDIDFEEEEHVQLFYDYLANNYDELITDEEMLKDIAIKNKLMYINESGLEAINLLKEYNPVRYVNLGKQKQLSSWAWEISEEREHRYTELKNQSGYDSTRETYLEEFISLIKSNWYFQECYSETYFNIENPRCFDTLHEAIFHEYMSERLFTVEEMEELVKNYKNDYADVEKMSPEIKDLLESNQKNREWMQTNKDTILLFNESVIHFVDNLNNMEEILG